MRARSILVFCSLALSFGASAQQTYNTIEFIDINNIKAGHLVHGDMWRNPATGTPACEYPKGSGKNIAGLGSLWFGGYDNTGTLMAAAQAYRQQGNDYFPGPVDTSIHGIAQSTQHSSNWARIWKVNKSTIDSFKRSSVHTVSNTPKQILEWPAKGNIYAKGAQQATLTINKNLAPFVDVNGDGIYNALSGDYPQIKGDQMLWCIFNEYMLPKENTQSSGIGLEIQQMVYAYNRNSSVDNMIFYEYSIKNVGNNTLPVFRMGLNIDFDLGYAHDDYIGFDSSHRMGYVYNAKSIDGNGEPTSYGLSIPIAGVSIMEFPGDSYPSLLPAGTFVPYLNDNNSNGNPASALEYNNLLSGRNRMNDVMHNDMAGGVGSTAFGSGPSAKYGFPGNPNDSTQWSQCNNKLPQADRRFVLATESLTLLPGDIKKIGMALLVSPDGGSCGNVNLRALQQMADSALVAYYNPPQALAVHRIASTARTLKTYPNPAKNLLHIVSPDADVAMIRVYDASGKTVIFLNAGKKNETVVETSQLASGTYIVEYRSGQTVSNNMFVKE